jgi:hypothetical protein
MHERTRRQDADIAPYGDAVDDHGRPVMAGRAQALESPNRLPESHHFRYSRMRS